MISFILIIAMQSAAPASSAEIERASDMAFKNESGEQAVLKRFADEARSSTPIKLQSASDTAQADWRKCLKEFAVKASVVQADPTPTIVEIAFLACSHKQTAAEWSWAKSTLISSSYKPDIATAYRWAKEAFAKFSTSEREGLLVHVSYERQIMFLRAGSK